MGSRVDVQMGLLEEALATSHYGALVSLLLLRRLLLVLLPFLRAPCLTPRQHLVHACTRYLVDLGARTDTLLWLRWLGLLLLLLLLLRPPVVEAGGKPIPFRDEPGFRLDR